MLRDRGDTGTAQAIYEEVLTGLRVNPGAGHPTTLAVLYEYSLLRKERRQLSEARRLAYELAAGAREALPTTHPDRLKYERHLSSLR